MTIHNGAEFRTASGLADLLLTQLEGKAMDLESDLALQYFEIVHALDRYNHQIKATSEYGMNPRGTGS